VVVLSRRMAHYGLVLLKQTASASGLQVQHVQRKGRRSSSRHGGSSDLVALIVTIDRSIVTSNNVISRHNGLFYSSSCAGDLYAIWHGRGNGRAGQHVAVLIYIAVLISDRRLAVHHPPAHHTCHHRPPIGS
jgi:hypothetical protein